MVILGVAAITIYNDLKRLNADKAYRAQCADSDTEISATP